MSSGACRSLVATMLTILAMLSLAVPVGAQTENLFGASTTTYRISPRAGTIRVVITLTLRNRGDSTIRKNQPFPVILEDNAVFQSGQASRREGSTKDLSGPWKSVDIDLPAIPAGERRNVSITYTLNEGAALNDRFPIRLGGGYVFTCIAGQPTDRDELLIVLGDAFRTTTAGTEMNDTPRGLTTTNSLDPINLFSCIEGTNPRQLVERSFLGPANRDITLQAYPENSGWLTAAQRNVACLSSLVNSPLPTSNPRRLASFAGKDP